MKKFFMMPDLDVKELEVEDIVLASGSVKDEDEGDEDPF